VNAQRFEADAVLLIGFGGPTRPEEIRPFIEHVLRGRRVPPGRIEEVAHHYELIGGRSPLNDHTEAQRAALASQLAQRTAAALPVHMGMWHAAPFLVDVLRGLADAGVHKLLGVFAAAFYDQATLQRYGSAIDEALASLADPRLQIRYVDTPEHHPGFIAANVEHVRTALAQLPAALRGDARVLFTAHSIPSALGHSSGYVACFESAARRIAGELGFRDYRCVYQSRSGSPHEPWLEPDVCDALKQESERGQRAVVLAPIGFVCDHVEVLYDLDIEAKQLANSLNIALTRAATVGVHPRYIEAVADSVQRAL
jgi:ferrochelatase